MPHQPAAQPAAQPAVQPAQPAALEQALSWPRALLLHIGPGVLFFASFLALAPLAHAAGLPRELGFTLAGLLVVSPLELWYLRRAARRRTGVASLTGAVDFRAPLPPRWVAALVAGLTVFAAVVYFGGAPAFDWLADSVFGWFPDSMRVGEEDLSDFSTTVAVSVVLLNLVGDGIISPIAEELYYRGHLMARLPVGRLLLPVASAGLFTAAHLWEPELWLAVFVVQVVNCWVVLRYRNVWTAVVFHIVANSTITLITLAGLLA